MNTVTFKNSFHLFSKIFVIIGCLLIFCTSSCGDKCKDITCNNDGKCINGSCLCPEYYEGPDCSIEKAPKKIKVLELTVTNFPSTRENGDPWDNNLNHIWPDLIVNVHRQGSSGFSSPAYILNVEPNGEATFTGTPYFTFNFPKQEYIIELLDWDFGNNAHDLMGVVMFTPYQKGENFPTTLTAQSENISFEMKVEYIHDN